MSILSVIGIRFSDITTGQLLGRFLLRFALICTAQLCPSAADASEQCEALVNGFLHSPNEMSLRELGKVSPEDCWNAVGTSNERLQIINNLVSNGNYSAAQYLASHLRQLDGGNLEDALIALGQFSEKEMEGFLDLARLHMLTRHQLSDSLTMLPLSMSDEPKAQLAAMERRRAAVNRISQKALKKCKTVALAAIDDFEMEIKKSIGSQSNGTSQ
jgi:hypothetical protein